MERDRIVDRVAQAIADSRNEPTWKRYVGIARANLEARGFMCELSAGQIWDLALDIGQPPVERER